LEEHPDGGREGPDPHIREFIHWLANRPEVHEVKTHRDEGQIHGDRREGGDGELVLGVQATHPQGRQGHEQEDREQRAGQGYGQLVFVGVREESVGEEAHHLGREIDAERDQGTHHQQEQGEDLRHEPPGLFPSLFLEGTGEGGDEGRGEGAFCEEVPEHGGDADGHEIRVGDPTRPEKPPIDGVPDISRDPADGGGDGNGAEMPS
jgi:hypothetical protein